MAQDLLHYDRLLEQALRNVIRDVLRRVASQGLPGAHHLYITFLTRHSGVEMPASLREQYPTEMTIVLQYQFWDLTVEDGRFGVTLSFNNTRQRLVVPFDAINAFADPSVNFALQFQPSAAATQSVSEVGATAGEDAAAGSEPAGASDNVVTLDTFRKK